LKGTHFLAIFLFLLVTTGAYFLYTNWHELNHTDVWELVPESAILVYESNQAVENWNEIQETEIWKSLEAIPDYANLRSSIEHLDSVAGGGGRLHQLLRQKSFTLSMHRIAQEKLDYLFYIPLASPKDLDMINSMIEHYQQRDDYSFRVRNFQDFQIHEAVNQEYQELFSYLLVEDYLIGSFTPHLIEDVIRNLSGLATVNFATANPDLKEVAKLENDQGNIYINSLRISELFEVFVESLPSQEASLLKNWGGSVFLDFKTSDDRILLNGFTVDQPQTNPFLSTVNGGQGGALGCKSMLPNNVASLVHLSIGDPLDWHQRLRVFWEAHHPDQLARWNSLSQDYQWDPLELVALQQREMGVASLSTLEDETPERIVYLKTSAPEQALELLNNLAEIAASKQGTSVFKESYGEHTLVQIGIKELPSILWGQLFKGADQVFYTTLDDYVLIGSSISTLKALHRSIESEETWGKSIVMNEFVEGALQEANLSYYVNLPQAWNKLNSELSESWKSFLDVHESTFSKFELLRVQFSDIGDKFYTSGVVTFNGKQEERLDEPLFQTRQQVFTDAEIVTKPMVVRNHNNGSREVLLQDSLKNIYLIGSQGRTLWGKSLDGLIKGAIIQIDYYKNNKLQYMLATEKNIHLIDRNGNEVEGFPVLVPTNTRIRNIGVLDYDNSKRYRFIVSDESGQVYMFDKQGKLLDGWNPKVLPDQLLFAPQHIRIRNKDCIIAIQENGVVQVLNRRGEPYPGFPLDLGGATNGPLFIQSGTDFESTNFTGVTAQGLIVAFDLNGVVKDRQQLVRPTPDTYYQLCLDPLDSRFVIKRQNANRLGILNRKGEIFFEKDYLSTSDLSVQYYLLNHNHSIFAVSDPVQQFTYCYDETGALINASPIESNGEIALLYFENQKQHQIYSVYDNKFSLHSF